MDAKLTAGPETHFSGGLVLKLSGEEMVSVLAFTYKMPDSTQTQIRVPGGSGISLEVERDGEEKVTVYETPVQTLIREVQFEVSEEGRSFSLPRECAHELYRKTVPGDPRKGGGIHHKVFFAITDSDLVCTPRRASIYEPDGVLLGPPSWHEAEGLVRAMFSDRTPKYHPIAVLKLIEILAEMYPLVSRRYGKFLRGNEEFMRKNA